MKRLWPVVLILLLPGCRDHPEPVTPVQPRPPSVAEQRQAEVGVWCDMIEQAALSEYANLGRRMHAQGRAVLELLLSSGILSAAESQALIAAATEETQEGPSWGEAAGIGYVYPEFVEQVMN